MCTPMTTVEQWALFIFNALGLHDKGTDWTPLARIDDGVDFVLTHEHRMRQALPASVVGDLTLLQSEIPLVRRKSLLAFLRRLASHIESSIVRRRSQRRVAGKNKSFYSYKWIRA